MYKIDKELDTPLGLVVFRGEVSEEELDHIVTLGLMSMVLQGQLIPTIYTADGAIIQDTSETLQ